MATTLAQPTARNKKSNTNPHPGVEAAPATPWSMSRPARSASRLKGYGYTLQDGEPNNCWLTTIAALPAQSSGFDRLVPVMAHSVRVMANPGLSMDSPVRRVRGRLYLTFQPVKDQ